MVTNIPEHETTLVLGGTGKTGRRVAHGLRNSGVSVRVGSRTGEPRFDWEDARTWSAVLRGVDAVYIAYAPDAGFPGADETIRAFTATATACGVRRLVLLTGRGDEGALRSEAAVRESGAAWTIVRASFFAQNFSEDFLADAVRGGVVAFPAGAVAEPFVDVRDVADVAVAALTDPAHSGQVHEVTGPRLWTFDEAVAEIAAAAGRGVSYHPVTPREFEKGMVEHGSDASLAAQVSALFAEVLDGRNAYVTDGVRRALGREPREFSDYVRGAAMARAWSDSPVASSG